MMILSVKRSTTCATHQNKYPKKKEKENKLVVYYAAGDVIPFILFQLISFNCYLISSPFFLSLSFLFA